MILEGVMMIEKWKTILSLEEWTITTEAIERKSVVYEGGVPAWDRYFVGIQPNHDTKIAVIYHDRDLTEEDVVHELLHVANPDWTEEQVNTQTDILLM